MISIVALAFLSGGFGLLIGSFLNVVVYRLPNGLSLSSPPSTCPGCDTRIRAYDNVPVLSWLLLRGKCRSCRERISTRYPLVELSTAIFFGLVAVRFIPREMIFAAQSDVISQSIVLIAFLYLAGISVALGLIDVDVHKLPNKIVLPAYVVSFVLFCVVALVSNDWNDLVRAVIGMAILYVFYLVLALAWPNGMGFGDVKLAGVLGIYLGWLGWGPLAVGAFAAFLIGGVFSIVLIALKRIGRKGGIPFGPWMLVGAWVGVFFGPAISRGYLALLGLV